MEILKTPRNQLRKCFILDVAIANPYWLLSLIPFEIWKHIMNISNLQCIVFLAQTCRGFHLLFENLQKNDVSIATRFRKEGQISLAKKSLQKCANNGNGVAMFHLGYAYSYGGWGVKKINTEKAIEWFKKSAETGNCSGLTHYSNKVHFPRFLGIVEQKEFFNNVWQKALGK